MRRKFSDELEKWMEEDPGIWIISIDLGYKMLDNIRDKFPDRFINTGAAEQAAVDIAIGLALEGKKPFVYSITPFLIYRPFESLRTYINHEKIGVRLVGGGRDDDYKHDGFSHNASDVKPILDLLPNITQLWPEDESEIASKVETMVYHNIPWFISLKR